MKPLVRSLCAVIISFLFLSLPLYAQTAEHYVGTGEVLLKKDPRQAFKSFIKALELSKQNGEWDQYYRTVNRLASLKDVLTDEEIDATFFQLKEAVAFLKNVQTDSSIARFHFHIAIFYDEYSYETDLPIAHFRSSIKIWSDLKGELNKEVAGCYHGLGDVYKYKKADFEEAEKCYEKALKIREQIHFDDARI
ncbi:MAG: hypothetical protein C0490_24580, partial [Marivirga sp.]|nr:hypothetical protein [Marivirga sp.]